MRFYSLIILILFATCGQAQVLTHLKVLLSGSGVDIAAATAVDRNGNVFVAGTTTSLDFPIVNGLIVTAPATGPAPAMLFLAKLDPSLSQILFSTYIGPVDTSGIGLTLDAAGNPLITGSTSWGDFPTTANALQPTFPSGQPGFAVKVRADGGAILYSTFLNNFVPGGAAFDASGNAVIVGSSQPGLTTSANAFQASAPGPCTRISIPETISPVSQTAHAFAAKISADGQSLLYATYLTGTCGDSANAVQLDASGNAYITGFTYSLDFPVTPNAMSTSFTLESSPGNTSAFVSELSSDGSKLLYSTFFGFGLENGGNAIALDASGDVYVAGYSETPSSAGAVSVVNGAGCDDVIPVFDYSVYENAFAMKMSLSAVPPVFVATIGGGCQDSANSLAVDSAGNLWIAGVTQSSNFPSMAPVGALGVGFGGFLAEIDPSGSKLLLSTPTGGANGVSPAVAAYGDGVYLASSITSASKPGAASAAVAYVDGSQTVPIVIDSLQFPASVPPPPPTFVPDYFPPTVAPGELVYLVGRGIGPVVSMSAPLTSDDKFPTSLAGVAVSFNGIPAPLVSIQADRIECQAPFELDGAGSVQIQVQYNGQMSNAQPAAVSPQQPWLLAAVNGDGTPNTSSNPARVGSVVTLYLTGLGQTSPAGIDGGVNPSAAAVPRSLPTLYVNNQIVQPAFLGSAPGESTGVTQLNFTVLAPQNASGSESVAIVPGTGQSPQLQLTLFVH